MMNPQLLEYSIHPAVRAFSTCRRGGFSQGLYADFNANSFCGDSVEHVMQNRRLLCNKLNVTASHFIIPHQVHGVEVAVVDEVLLSIPEEKRAVGLDGIDAVITNIKGVCVSVSTADCIPLLLYDKRQQVVAAVHAGWRGTVKRIARHTLEEMNRIFGTHGDDVLAVIGPGISLDAFEVGDEVLEVFSSNGFDVEKIAKRMGKWHIDLPLANSLTLQECGVLQENIQLSGVCTYTQCDCFFSARRLGIHSGRITNGIMLL